MQGNCDIVITGTWRNFFSKQRENWLVPIMPDIFSSVFILLFALSAQTLSPGRVPKTSLSYFYTCLIKEK